LGSSLQPGTPAEKTAAKSKCKVIPVQ
jgi:hypothetical protein